MLIKGLNCVIPRRLNVFLKKMADCGWFVPNFDTISGKEINVLISYLYSNQIDEIDKYFIKYFKENYERLKDIIIEKYINRKVILIEAFESFEAQRFYSAIVLFLTQIDGICYDYFGEKFFLNDPKNNYKPKVFPKIRKTLLEQHHFTLGSIEQKTPINMHQSELNRWVVYLNRHEIIHGIDIDFGNELNAYKILSMIAYLTKIIEGFCFFK
ncbi:hypothetical protein ACT29H_00045 [Thermophagus sp. OGC60D27]|uniref:hypothetical protein n=1 Tax=Thermophagus sp. OGC60D27 TaxID=3458415 RepID=UPI004037695C